jgi:peroxiredoxin Q/BCP
VATAYGVWGPKTSYGKTTMGINRSAFVIDEEGRITAALYGIKPEATTTRSLAALAG